MPSINDLFPSKFLKAYDLQGHTPIVKIARVDVVTMGRTREVLPVVFFAGKQKGLKLNKTCASAIQAIAGSALTEKWVGVAVQLYATVASFGDQTFDVIRIRAVPAASGSSPRRAAVDPALAQSRNGSTRASASPSSSSASPMSQTSQTRRPVPIDETELDLMESGR